MDSGAMLVGLGSDLLGHLRQTVAVAFCAECARRADIAIFFALLLLLAVQGTPSRATGLRNLLFVLTAGTLAVLLVKLAGLIPDKPDMLSAALWLSALWGAAWLLGKLALANRIAGMRDARYPLLPATGKDTGLLPSQSDFVNEVLIPAVMQGRGFRAVGIHGGWGSGKTRIVEGLHVRLHDHAAVSVQINIWEYQNHDDLQWGVLESLYAHPRTLASHAWLSYPLFMPLMRWMRSGLVKFKIALFGSEISGDGQLRLYWQGYLQKAVARHARAGHRVVFILDEIDRATPAAVQAALTLIQRSLSLEAISVVVPYVQEQIQHKAFNPILAASGDIRATAAAWMIENLSDPYGDTAVRYAKCQEAAVDAFYLSLAGRWADSPERQNDYFAWMEEKYLRTRYSVPPLNRDDAESILRLPQIAALVESNCKDKVSEAVAALETVLEKLAKRGGRLSIRALLGEAMYVFGLMPGNKELSPAAQVALIVGLAINKPDFQEETP